ncbi:DMT family transporter [Tropicimonas sp.]|uniref:DMT family transporter n=1 Tax=Tropicimonas sp. TaxID=2067044 RepID=UPI003A8B9D13
MSPNARGAFFMAASAACYVLNDTLIKLVAGEMSLYQALLIRGVAATALMIALAAALGMHRFGVARRDRAMVLVRTLAEIGASYFLITALFHMPLANAAAIMQALPLTVTLAGSLVFGEKIGWRRLSAILVGFAGVMLIVRPGASGFSLYSAYAVIAVICVTIRDLAARGVSIETSSMGVALASSLGVLAFGAAGMLAQPWQPVSLHGGLALLGASVAIIGGMLFSILTMRVGEIAFVSPFRYLSMLWALLMGFAVFGEWPDMLTLLGAGIVVATGVFSLHRESRLASEAERLARLREGGQACVDKTGDSH